jgi:hypothetical protein
MIVVVSASHFSIHSVEFIGRFRCYELYAVTTGVGRFIILASIIMAVVTTSAIVGMSETVVWCFRRPISKQFVQKERWAMFIAMMMMVMITIGMTRSLATWSRRSSGSNQLVVDTFVVDGIATTLTAGIHTIIGGRLRRIRFVDRYRIRYTDTAIGTTNGGHVMYYSIPKRRVCIRINI